MLKNKNKRQGTTQNGFGEFAEYLKQADEKEMLPQLPLAHSISAEELIRALDVRITDPDIQGDRFVMLDAITDDEGGKAGIRIRDAKPCLLHSEPKLVPYDDLADWILQNDCGHILCGHLTNSAQILEYLCSILKELLHQGRIPKTTFHLFEDYVLIGIEITDGCFFDRKTKAEMTLPDAKSREKNIRSGWIRAWMDRCGESPDRIEKETQSAMREIDQFYEEIIADGRIHSLHL